MGASLRQRFRNFHRALAIKIIFLAIVFLVVPIVFYRLFQVADAQQTALLESTVQEKGQLIAAVLKDHLGHFQDEPPDVLQRALEGIATKGTNIKVLLRMDAGPGAGGFSYIAAAPAVAPAYLAQERDQLIKMGVFGRLDPACDAGISPTLRFTNPAGQTEVLTSMTPLYIGTNCWVIITSQTTNAVLSSPIGQPIWRTPTMHIAALVYLLSAVIVAWVLVDIWRNLDRFRTAARKIRTQGERDVSFREMNTIPELNGVADDFDSLVAALKQSRQFIIQAAEENAHALKAPLAVISQAVEPLKRAITPGNLQARRSLDLIERSTARLDILVSSARDLEQAAADVLYPNSRPIDLSAYLAQLAAAYEPTLTAEGKRLESVIERDVNAYANEEAMEAILENLLENAASFTRPGGTVEVQLHTVGESAELTVADEGPGVPPEHLTQIFERNFSLRAHAPGDAALVQVDQHYGLGLWIVRRNVEGLGGQIRARNRESGGFAVTISLPLAH
jgi:two-component system, OmpR family, sensor histidine kinase ChvG